MLAVVAPYRQCLPFHTPDYTRPGSRHRVAVHQGISYVPVERPTKFELVINRNTAKAFPLTTPQSLLMRADQIIQ